MRLNYGNFLSLYSVHTFLFCRFSILCLCDMPYLGVSEELFSLNGKVFVLFFKKEAKQEKRKKSIVPHYFRIHGIMRSNFNISCYFFFQK